MKKTLKGIYVKMSLVRKILCIAIYYLFSLVFNKPLWKLISMNATQDQLVTREIVYEVIIYGILLIFTLALTLPDLIHDFEVVKKKKISRFFVEIAIGLGISYVLMIVGSFISSYLNGGFSTSINESSIDSLMYSPYSMLLVPTVTIIGPVVEELVFRKNIQEGLTKLKVHPIVAIIISGTIFGFLHVFNAGDYTQVFSYLFLGLWFGYMYYYSENIITTCAMHVLINSISTCLQYILIIYELLMKNVQL